MSLAIDGEDATCYQAESIVSRRFTTHFRTPEQVRGFMDYAVTTRWMQNHWPRVWKNPPKLKLLGAVLFSEAFVDKNLIHLAESCYTDWDVIHELAHICVGNRERTSHGPKFCRAHCELLTRFIGPEAGRSMRYAYKALGML